MKFTIALAAAGLAASAQAASTHKTISKHYEAAAYTVPKGSYPNTNGDKGNQSGKKNDPTLGCKYADKDLLNLASTVEALTLEFFRGGLMTFSQQNFTDAGFSRDTYDMLYEALAIDNWHLGAVTSMLGADAAPSTCNYTFPYHDPASFMEVAQQIKGSAVSAYNGMEPLFKNATLGQWAVSLSASEARSSALINNLNGNDGLSVFEAPLNPNQAYSFFADFIDSCPTDVPDLPFNQYPNTYYTVSKGGVKPGATMTFKWSGGKNTNKKLYAHFLSGLNIQVVPLTNHRAAKIPDDLWGRSYVFISTSAGVLNDTNTVAGPSVLDIDIASWYSEDD